jgi:hypothetical protein
MQNELDNIRYRRAFSIYRKEDVLFQLKIRGASEKFKNQQRPLLRPRSINFRQHFRNLSRKTVPLKKHILQNIYKLIFVQQKFYLVRIEKLSAFSFPSK